MTPQTLADAVYQAAVKQAWNEKNLLQSFTGGIQRHNWLKAHSDSVTAEPLVWPEEDAIAVYVAQQASQPPQTGR